MKIFLEVSASAMVNLKAGNKSNVNYNLAKGVGTNRLDESESIFTEGKGTYGTCGVHHQFLCSG